MKNVLHKKGWNPGTKPAHVELLLPLLMKETYNSNPDEYFVKLKLRRDPTSSMSDLYEFKMSLFDHGKPEEFLLFICNFNMTRTATGNMYMDAKIQYLLTLFHGEAFCQFVLLSAEVENTETLNVDFYINNLASYFPPMNSLSKKKRAMRRGMKNLSA